MPFEDKEGCLDIRKMLEMPENTGFTGSVVADWLHNIVAKMLPE